MSGFVNKFSPSILDSFHNYLNAEVNYERFIGFTDEPSKTFDEYEKEQFDELINKINRVPFESEAADKGSAFNEIVDCLVMNVRSTRDDIFVKSISDNTFEDGEKPDYYVLWADKVKTPCVFAKKGDFKFFFDMDLCLRTGDYFADSLCQIYTEAPIETKYGTVLLYGYPDYVRKDVVYDLKTTSKYDFGKYKDYWQQHVYPYTLTVSGKVKDIRAFEFTAFQLRGGSSKTPLITGEMYPEVYTYDHRRSEMLLRGICEQFHVFLENNRGLISDRKIFGGEKD